MTMQASYTVDVSDIFYSKRNIWFEKQSCVFWCKHKDQQKTYSIFCNHQFGKKINYYYFFNVWIRTYLKFIHVHSCLFPISACLCFYVCTCKNFNFVCWDEDATVILKGYITLKVKTALTRQTSVQYLPDQSSVY